MTSRNHLLISDDSYDEALAFPELPLREQVANRLAEALWAADQIIMLIDQRIAQAPREIIDLLPRVRALYDGANTLMKEVEN